MALYNAMTNAISGLNSQSTKMNHISANIANVNTTAYKKVGTTFSSLVTVSNATTHNGAGVSAAPQYNVTVGGAVSASAITTNLAISGNGFFKVTNSPYISDTAGQDLVVYYTRKGDFDMDQYGNLVNSSGYYLCGRTYDMTTGLLDPTSTGNSPVNFGNITGIASATTNMTLGANLPAADANVIYNDATVIPTYPAAPVTPAAAAAYRTFIESCDYQITQTVYDGQGIPHQVSTVWVPIAAGSSSINPASSPDGWVMITVELDKTVEPNEYIEHFRVHDIEFDNNGSLVDNGGAGWNWIAGASSVNAQMIGQNLVVSWEPGGNTPVGNPIGNGSLSWAWDNSMGNINIDMGTPGQARGMVQNGVEFAINYASQDGLPYGQFQSVSVDEFGYVYAHFSNGLIKKAAKLEVTVFSNPNGLQALNNDVFSATVRSGDPITLDAGVGRAGLFVPSALEGSNVDLAEEFTNMILAQRAYSANGKMITTADDMLAELISLKR